MEGTRDPRISTRERNGWAEPGRVSSQRGEDGEGDAFLLGGGAGTRSDLEVTVL